MSRGLSVTLLFGLLAPSGALVLKSEKDDSKFCIEDMCVAENLPYVYKEVLEQFPLKLIAENATLSANPPSNRRTLLINTVHAYHGSTALQGLLMSSPQLATLCKANTWQCEAAALMNLNDPLYNSYSNRQDKWNWTQALAVLGEVWDLKRHYLFQKDPWLPGCRKDEAVVAYDDPWAAHLKIKAAAQGELPLRFQMEGIKQLDLEYLMMWRPVCIAKLSSHYADGAEDEEFELRKLEEQVEFHKYLKHKGERVHVLSLADLMWLPKRTATKLHKNLPHLSGLSPSYTPELMKDVYPGNQWKAKGSVEEFGKRVDPNKLNYSVKDRSCMAGTSGFVHLPEAYQARITAATEYLKKHSE